MDHAVIVHLRLSADGFGTGADFDAMVELSDRMEEAIEAASVGEFDGNEVGGGECALFMYGPNADRLFDAVAPVLQGHYLARGGYVVKRYGGVNEALVPEVKLPL